VESTLAKAPRRILPLWSLALCGAIAASAAQRVVCAPRDSPRAGRPRPPPAALSQLSARQLRALPGIGEQRALALVEARWRRAPGDPPLYLHDLPGIGPAVESAVRAALAAGLGAAQRPGERGSGSR